MENTGNSAGTRFRVIFPAVAASLVQTGPEFGEAKDWTATGTVLVVDDEASVRELVEDTLSRVGLDVLSAADGGEGVELFAKHADRIAAVLLDCAMPVTSGDEAFEQILRIRPDAKILLMSGYSEQQLRTRFPSDRLARFLRKPFLPEVLVARIRAEIEDTRD